LTNPLKTALRADRVVLGIGAVTQDPIVIELVGKAGFDFVWIDTEHGGFSPYDATSIENTVRAAQSSGTSVLFRVPTANSAMIQKALDAGVQAIVVSGVSNKQEAKALSSAARWPIGSAQGERGFSISRYSDWLSPDASFLERINEEVLIGPMIESKEAVGNLSEILSVDGIDFLFVGPGDLSMSLGLTGQFSHPLVKQNVQKILDTAHEFGIPAGYPVSNVKASKEIIANGFKIVRCGTDIGLLHEAFRQIVGGLRA
jgi:2-keto-3-deoxy-L-rhamnonate aldolase RhmA